jgi:hypothetical protein
MQSRRSLLVWKIFGRRLDGFTNADHPSPEEPGGTVLYHRGEAIGPEVKGYKSLLESADIDYHGSVMPPPEAVAGTYEGPDGRKIKVAPLSDEDRRTLVRWIDLGCPVDLNADRGMMLDEGRPTLVVASPRAGSGDRPLERILLGMHDYDTGPDPDSLTVSADFEVDGIKPGENLAKKFKPLEGQRWEMKLNTPLTELRNAKLTVTVKDRQGNVSRMERTFSIVPSVR